MSSIFFTQDELALLVAIVGTNVNPEQYPSPKAKAVIYKAQALVKNASANNRSKKD